MSRKAPCRGCPARSERAASSSASASCDSNLASFCLTRKLKNIQKHIGIAPPSTRPVNGLPAKIRTTAIKVAEPKTPERTVREDGAAALLTWEFRGLSAAGGYLYTIKPDTVALRSTMATGIICAKADTAAVYGIDGRTGQIFTTADDSAMVYLPGIGQWVELDLTDQFDQPVSNQDDVKFCAWGNGSSYFSDLVVRMAGDTTGIQVGTPWAAFRRVEFGIYEDGGRWWLGRKVGNAGSYEKLTGPLLSPTDGGFVLSYLDDAGNTTTDPTQVSKVQIEIRSQSTGRDRGQARQDSIQVTVWLRG